MTRISFHGLLGLALLTLPLVAQANSAPVDPSPPAHHDLICSPTDVTDCYPRVFQPTKDFQIIREGQDLPPGLHVRMNIYAGTKEARLNIPMEGEEGAAVEAALSDLPVEQSVVVVDQPVSEEDTKPALRDQVPINPPTFDTAGKILPPPPSADGTDMGTFQKALLAIKMEARAFDTALDDLMELSHDIYYGLEIAKDGPVLEKLVCLTLGSGSEKIPAGKNGREHKAASILASSIQNNPTALKEVAKWGNMVFFPMCSEVASGKSENGNFVSTLRSRLGREKDAGALKAKITAISGLLHDDTFRTQLLENSGMELLLAVFLKKGDEFDPVRQKVAQLVTDNFLDEGMGANLGIWPKMPVTESKVCKEQKNRMLEDGCWEHHVGVFGEGKPELTWVKEFQVLLKEQRAKYGDSIKDREL